MKRTEKIGALCGLLAVCCAAAFAAAHTKQKQEDIRETGETILEIDENTVTALSWENEDGSLSFSQNDGVWTYDTDSDFPADPEKLTGLLAAFHPLNASFIIENAEDTGQYGLDDPICTIRLTADGTDYEILLGDYSAMDSKRYVSIGDGNVYLAAQDPYESFDAGLSDVILNDELPAFETARSVTFSGDQDYSIAWKEESGSTFREDDHYFAQLEDEELPLDTGRVEDYLYEIKNLDLSDYVTYRATGEDLASCGLDEPQLTISIDYRTENEEGEESEKTFLLHVSRDPKEQEEAEKKETSEKEQEEDGSSGQEDAEETITAYARVADSPILYRISGSAYEALMAAGPNDLRHRAIRRAGPESIDTIDISMDGSRYTLTREGSGDSLAWLYEGEELETKEFQNALTALQAAQSASFDVQDGGGEEEIRLTLHLDLEGNPQAEISFLRYDGDDCLAVLDGTPLCYVSRESVVRLIEAVHSFVL